MSSNSNKANWNELEYISWKEFKNMAPPVITLEINRIGKMINEAKSESDDYNALIRARYELSRFVECLEQTDSPPMPDSCIANLRNAILNLSLGDTDEMIHYILDRLNYVYYRIRMIY